MGTVLRKLLIWALVGFLALPGAPLSAAESGNQTFKPEEIEQIVAPIALYPDSLVSQILMASTYPLEVVEAARWVRQNQNLTGDALAAALEKQSWDPSVKSLVNFPQVLSTMSEKLDQTQKLGDVFLAQQKDVLDAIQRLRAKAEAAGNLKTTQEQKVIVEEKIIKIEEYGSSGIMTFIVNHDGFVYQKDLGANTASVAQSMTKFNPDKTWTALKQ